MALVIIAVAAVWVIPMGLYGAFMMSLVPRELEDANVAWAVLSLGFGLFAVGGAVLGAVVAVAALDLALRHAVPHASVWLHLRRHRAGWRCVRRTTEVFADGPHDSTTRADLAQQLLASVAATPATWRGVEAWLDDRRPEIDRLVARETDRRRLRNELGSDLGEWLRWHDVVGHLDPSPESWRRAGFELEEAAAMVADGASPDEEMLAAMAAVLERSSAPSVPRSGARG